MWGRAVDYVILLSLQEHLQGGSTRYCPSALGSQIAGGLCVASILIDFRTFKLRKSCGLLLSTSLVISHNDADNPIYRHFHHVDHLNPYFFITIFTLPINSSGRNLEMAYNIGDVVYLNSGSPYMTVTYLNPREDEVHCKWFFNGQQCHGNYPSAALTLKSEDTEAEAGSVKLWD